MHRNVFGTRFFALSRALALLGAISLFLGFSGKALAQAKNARPDSTVADGGWTPAAPNTHLEIDDVVPDDATTLAAVLGAVGTLEVGLSNFNNPNPSHNHVMTFRFEADAGNGARSRCSSTRVPHRLPQPGHERPLEAPGRPSNTRLQRRR